jgi:hypothetical protein
VTAYSDPHSLNDGGLAGEQRAETRRRADRGADIDRQTCIAVGEITFAVFEEGLVAGVWPQDLIAALDVPGLACVIRQSR